MIKCKFQQHEPFLCRRRLEGVAAVAKASPRSVLLDTAQSRLQPTNNTRANTCLHTSP